ncbi:MAG: nucleotidyl transferase AbiEii/AbiGii toxin family protein [Rickettsiaceae bacterium]|nr:nucleotidyl transferase AbiEii/AbiGii toxin family protein [Rickettsiaceae bacterium]
MDIYRTKTLRKEFDNLVERSGAKWNIIEQDYILSWVLFGIVSVDKLAQHLVFKGGTALKKCYFGDYRFSQDLDFSVCGEYPKNEELLMLIEQACSISETKLRLLGRNIDIACTRYLEKQPHPENQEAFTIKARLPWQKNLYTNVMIEVTTQERVLLNPDKRRIIHGYGEEIDSYVKVYRLEEIIAEKIRALLQFAKKLHERGWGRSRVRDYYDIWNILTLYSRELDHSILPDLTTRKCALKQIKFTSFLDIFAKELIDNASGEWDIWLGAVNAEQHPKERIFEELMHEMKKLDGLR